MAADGRCDAVSAKSAEPLLALGTVELRTRRQVILDRLRDAVIEGELPAGTHLAEVELSESLGVSRGTLREAFRHLQQEGLLTADSRGRLTVRRVSSKDVGDIFQVRAALECLAVEIVCAQSDRTAVADRLEVLVVRMDDESLSFAQRVQSDLDFHEALVEASDNETLLASWRGISGLARGAIIAAGPDTAINNMRTARHRPIIDHVRDGDPVAARIFLQEHMSSAASHVIGAIPA